MCEIVSACALVVDVVCGEWSDGGLRIERRPLCCSRFARGRLIHALPCIALHGQCKPTQRSGIKRFVSLTVLTVDEVQWWCKRINERTNERTNEWFVRLSVSVGKERAIDVTRVSD